MDESDEPNKPPADPPAPEVERLLKMLEIQAATRRQQRAPASNLLQTSSFRYGSLIAIVLLAFGSLALLEWVLSQMPRPRHGGASPASAEVIKSGT